MRLAKEIKPKFIFLENVPAITTRGGLDVVRTITEMGYDSRWCVISAACVGALHKRQRWFLLAHANNDGPSASTPGRSTGECVVPRRSPEEKQAEVFGEVERTSGLSSDVADTNSQGCNTQQGGQSIRFQETHSESTDGNIENGCNTNNQSSKQTNQASQSQQGQQTAWGRSPGQHWPFESREHWQKVVSEMGKCSHGIPYHVDRLRSLGNAVVPKQAREAFKILMGLK